jgi:cleavage stimulation factor subunit 3
MFNIFCNFGAIYLPNTPEIFLPLPPMFYVSEHVLMGKWKAHLKWEESNPLEIEEKDKAILITCIQVYPLTNDSQQVKYYGEKKNLAYLVSQLRCDVAQNSQR